MPPRETPIPFVVAVPVSVPIFSMGLMVPRPKTCSQNAMASRKARTKQRVQEGVAVVVEEAKGEAVAVKKPL